MKKIISQIFVILIIGLLSYLSFSTLTPSAHFSKEIPDTEFSTKRAFQHVEKIAQKPHYVGSDNHSQVRNYIVNQLQEMGLSVHTQNGYVMNSNGILTNPDNIVTRLEGSAPKPGSDLLVLAHYDSAPHSSFGASDDGAAVAAILESIRAFLKNETPHKNNIIFCITDAEEIGLLGAQLFAEQHPWIENVGLVINFEARGTSGPANTIIETNHGNANLVSYLADARPANPMASSLMYEIYKNMPNDTDATVFREEKDIPSFFFAFIDDHFNYHSATDIPKNLDKNSLAHLGSYLTALLPYLGNHDLSELQTAQEQVYFNFPLFNIIHYSQAWILPLLIIGWLLFIFILIVGIRKQVLNFKNIAKGFIPFLLTLVLCYVIGYYGWQLVLKINPQYLEIQQGFPYNGHTYIAAFVLLGLAILFGVYHRFTKSKNREALLIAPLFFWLVINLGLSLYFKGATYFIIPVILTEIAFGLMLYRKRLSVWLRLLLCAPAIFIFAPLILYVPVALGMKNIFMGLVLLVLLFVLFLPVFVSFNKKNWLAVLTFIGGLVFVFIAQKNSGFTKDHPKPNSLVYVLDKDHHKASWNTYDGILDEWTKKYIQPENHDKNEVSIMGSKYGEGFTYTSSAPVKPIPSSEISVSTDTLKGSFKYKLRIVPRKETGSIILYSHHPEAIKDLRINRIDAENFKNYHSKISRSRAGDRTRLVTYFPVDEDTLRLDFKSIDKNDIPDIEIYEASNNLLRNPWLKVEPRTKTMMPRPFVLNDAIVIKHHIAL